jgi:hypothetical protein
MKGQHVVEQPPGPAKFGAARLEVGPVPVEVLNVAAGAERPASSGEYDARAS